MRVVANSSVLLSTLVLLSACNGDKEGGTDTIPSTDDSGTEVTDDSGSAGTSPPVHELDPESLPSSASAVDGAFTSYDACAECHENNGGQPLSDDDGRDVSPVTLWSGTMMANSARDPYFLARLAHEVEHQPVAEDAIVATCTRCHAPAAHELAGGDVDMESLLTSSDDDARLGREGTTCTLCHQITDTDLGTEASFTGGFVLGEDRLIYGPHEDPYEHPMQMHVDYTPTASEHMLDSGVCASCHTVITQAIDAETGEVVGPAFPEQVPYLEWTNSGYPAADASCQTCHMPQTDEDGDPIVTKITTKPNNSNIEERDFLGRHLLVGGNAYMLGLIADNADWVNPTGGEDAVRDQVEFTKAFIGQAARVDVEASVVEGQLQADVTVVNLAGHKLPTAYPSRRAFLRLTVSDGEGTVLWQSGRTDDKGHFVDAAGTDIDGIGAQPHRDTIAAEDEIQVYESVMHDASDQPTSLLLQATHYGKDNRLLPAGWSSSHEDIALMVPVGTDDDTDHMAGQDTVHYRLTLPEGAATVTAELVYQSVPLVHVADLGDSDAPLVERMTSMATASPDTGHVIAEDSTEL